MLSSGQLWGRHANLASPGSGSGPPSPSAGSLVRVAEGQHLRHYVDGLRTNTVAVPASGSWTIYKWGWQSSGSQALDEALRLFFGAFGAASDDAMVRRWHADPFGFLRPWNGCLR